MYVCERKITRALCLYLSLYVPEGKRPKENLKQHCFLMTVSSGGFLKKEIPVGNECSGYPPLAFQFTYAKCDRSLPRCLLEVFRMKQGLGC